MYLSRKKRCECLAPAVIGNRCRYCHAADLRRAQARADRARAAPKDPFGAIRNGEGKGIHKVTLPLGTVVIRKHNGHETRFIKIRMDGESGRRWMPFARWWWEKNRGPIPKGELVIHVDGDEMNDDPKNLTVGSPGLKLVFAHRRDPQWSRAQHGRAAAACADWNRKMGRVHRARAYLQNYWYPVIDSLGVILNVPFRKRKRLLACFGADVTAYPRNGHGKKPTSKVQRALRSCPVTPVKSPDLGTRRYSTYCTMDPVTKEYRGPVSMSIGQLVAQLDRMGIWAAAEKLAARDLTDLNRYSSRKDRS